MQQNPPTRTIAEKKQAKRKNIEVIVGRKPEPGEAVPEKTSKVIEKLNESEVEGRSIPIYVESPYTGRILWVYLEYEGEWFTDPDTGRSFQVWY